MEADGDEEAGSLITPPGDLPAVPNIPPKRKAEESASSSPHDGDSERREEGGADIGTHGDRGVKKASSRHASTEHTPTDTKAEVKTTSLPAKKKSKSSKAEESGAKVNSKDVLIDDRSSVTTDDVGTPDIPTMADSAAVAESSGSATKKAPKKKAPAASSGTTKGKRKKKTTAALSGQSSNASTPPVADREESTALPDIEEDEQQQQQQQQKQEQSDSSEESEKLYCICKTLYDDESMMIACDRCDEWYHSSCMQMSEDQTKLVDNFICPYCEPLTALRTTWKEQCARPGCTNAALPPLTRYCGEECGMLLAASRIAKLTKQMKGMTPQDVAEKLSAQQIVTASKREGVTLWEQGQERRKWLESVLSAGKKTKTKQTSEFTADLDGFGLNEEAKVKVDEMAELEILSRLQSRRRQVARLREGVNNALDALSARTKLLHLAEDRVPTLEPIQQDEADDGESRTKSSKKSSSSSKKSKGAGGDEEGQSTGQPRCGYDDRLNWENARFHAWCQTDRAKAMLDEQEALDGTLITDEEGKAALPPDQVAICGRSRRKCKRHVDWSVIRSAEMEVDRDVQTNLLSALDDEEQEVKGQLEQVQTRIKDTLSRQQVEARERDALLALQLAHEGTRRAIQPL